MITNTEFLQLPSTLLLASNTRTHLILSAMLGGGYWYPHFIDEETEAQGAEGNYPRSGLGFRLFELNRLGNFRGSYLGLAAALHVGCSVPGSSDLQGNGSNWYLSLNKNPLAILGIRRQRKRNYSIFNPLLHFSHFIHIVIFYTHCNPKK